MPYAPTPPKHDLCSQRIPTQPLRPIVHLPSSIAFFSLGGAFRSRPAGRLRRFRSVRAPSPPRLADTRVRHGVAPRAPHCRPPRRPQPSRRVARRSQAEGASLPLAAAARRPLPPAPRAGPRALEPAAFARAASLTLGMFPTRVRLLHRETARRGRFLSSGYPVSRRLGAGVRERCGADSRTDGGAGTTARASRLESSKCGPARVARHSDLRAGFALFSRCQRGGC